MTTAVPAPRAPRPRVGTVFDPSSERGVESLALVVGAIAFIVSALVALAVFRLQSAPIAGAGSIGQFAAIAGAAAAILAFVAARCLLPARATRVTVLDVVDLAALSFAHGIIVLLLWTLLADLLAESFIGAEVFALPLLALAGAAGAVSAYAAFLSATHMNLSLLALILAVFLVLGVMASMLTSSDPQWWKMNLSALGMTDDVSALTFNLTLIVAGVIVTTLARYATKDIPTPDPRGARNLRICLVVIGVFLACVGVFHVDVHFWIHNTVATGMAAAFAVAAIRLHAWVPGLPGGFILVGLLFIAVVVALGIFFAVGYYTLTAVELVAGLLIFSWIILLLRGAAALQTDTAA